MQRVLAYWAYLLKRPRPAGAHCKTGVFPSLRKPARQCTPRRITVLMAYTPEVADYGDIAAELNSLYCNARGYDLRVVKGPRFASDRHITWEKVAHTLKLLRELPDENYVFWIDCDAYFNRSAIQLERFAPDDANISICTELLGQGTNTGTFLVRNCQWSRDFLRLWWASAAAYPYYARGRPHEQGALDQLIMDGAGEGKVALFYKTDFNSDCYIPSVSDRVCTDFVVHYMGRTSKERRELMGAALASRKILLNIMS
jgi:hypothetical protein